MKQIALKNMVEAQKVLNDFVANPANIISIESDAQLMIDYIYSKGKIISCGNGGSMCDAMHFAE